jgi:site-specific recombinase XerD
LKAWRANPRRWSEGVLMALPEKARVFEDGVFCKRTSTGLSWGIYYRVPVLPGSRRTKPKQEVLPHCRNKTQAEGVLSSTKGKIFEGEYQPRTRRHETTLAKFLPDFVKLKADRASVKTYEAQITREHLPRWGSMPLRAIKRAEIKKWYVHRLTEAEIATANNELAALRSLFSEAIDQELCELNPAKGIKPKAANNARDRVLSDVEVKKLGAAMAKRTDHARPLFALLYFTGARLSEVLELTRDAVDLVRGVVRYKDAKDGRLRNVPLSQEAAEHVRPWLDSHDKPFVFPGRLKGRHRVKLGDEWRAMIAEAKVQVTPHELRHNFVSQLQAQGVADTIIMDLTGHRTLAMLKRYSHSRDHHRAAAVAKLPGLGAEQSPVNHLKLLGGGR